MVAVAPALDKGDDKDDFSGTPTERLAGEPNGAEDRDENASLMAGFTLWTRLSSCFF